MDLNGLQTELQSQVTSNGTVSISEQTITAAQLTPRQGFDGLVQGYLLLTGPLILNSGTIPAAAASTLSFNATGSFLGLSNVSIGVEFVLNSDNITVDVRLTIALDAPWTLSTSFPSLQGYPVNSLTLITPSYLFTTLPGDSVSWNQNTVALTPGLNLASYLQMSGAMGLLESVLQGFSQSGQLLFVGPIDPTHINNTQIVLPDASISGTIPYTLVNVPPFSLDSPSAQLSIFRDSSNQQYSRLNFLTTLSINSIPFFDFQATLLDGAANLQLAIVPDPSKPITITNIVDLLGGSQYPSSNFTSAIPSELQYIFNAVSLQGLSAILNLSSVSLTAISVAVGSSGPWTVGQFTADSIILRYTVLNPLTQRSNAVFTFDAVLTVFPTIFDGSFEFLIGYDPSSQEFTLSAAYQGAVSLNALIAGISDGAIQIPTELVAVSFEDFGLTLDKTGTSQFDWSMYGNAKVTFSVAVLGGAVEADLFASVASTAGVMDYKLIGGLSFGNSFFQLLVDLGQTEQILTASWTATGTPLGINSIATTLGFSSPDIPASLDLNLVAASVTYDFGKKEFVLTADSANWGKAVFGGLSVQGSWQYFFGLNIAQPHGTQIIDLSNLPLIGKALQSPNTVVLQNIQAVVSSAAIDSTNAGAINGIIPSGYPQTPAAGMAAGAGLSLLFTVGTTSIPISIGTTASSQSGSNGGSSVGTNTGAGGQSTVPSTTAPDGTVWFALQKTLGPVTFQKVGIKYDTTSGILYFLMNASLAAGGLTIATQGLGVGSPLTTFEPTFTCTGIDITFAEGPIAISGGLIGSFNPVNLYGELTISTSALTIAAIGGYADYENQPSFFLYAVLDYPIGGPSFFFVTGLAAGFGYNRKLLIPPITGVSTFPLVQWAVGTGNPPGMDTQGNIDQQVSSVLTRLTTSGVIAPSIGDYWLALGIRFTSFEMLDSFALLTVIFGTQFEIALLGLSTLTVPTADPYPVAKVQLELEVTFAPSTGLLAVSASLTPQSYVLAPQCHLTGGFAFYVWFSGTHQGEFVVTLGGYGSRFTPPNYYPQVAPLGLNWQVVPELIIKGDLYFALTSSAIMAGGGMSAVWKSGGISAWFIVQADFLMTFQPFHYYISASIQLGASFKVDLLFTTVTITIHIGVGIQIWGPEFAGEAEIDLSIISFTIDFGSSGKQTGTTIPWTDFANQLLPSGQSSSSSQIAASDPPPPSVVQINVAQGLVKQLSTTQGDLNYILNGQTALLTTVSAIPAKDYVFSSNITIAPDSMQPQYNGTVITPNTDFGIGPTGTASADFTSTHNITITTSTNSTFFAVRTLHNAPKSLWNVPSFDSNGVPQVDPVNDTTLPNVVNGYQLVPSPGVPGETLPIQIQYLQYTIDPKLQQFDWGVPTYVISDSYTTQTVAQTISTPPASSNMPQILASINRNGLIVSSTVNVSSLANQATSYLLAEPVLNVLGEQKVG